MDFLEEYNKINNTFKKKCIFKVGESQGFFSELNNMIYAMLYCLENKIQFVLTSVSANFAPEKGWEEFFLPFCKQEYGKFHAKKFNVRFKNDMRKSIKRKVISNLYKIIHRVKLTQDIFEEVYPAYMDKHIDIPELNWHGKTNDIIKPLAEMVWRFNPQTQAEVDKVIKTFNLPEKYAAIHMRRGDKITFFNNITASPDEYMTELKKLTTHKDIVVLCDDYNDLITLKENYKEYRFHSTCRPTDNGYANADFQSLEWTEKRKKLIELFATMDAMRKADLFIGTDIANPYLFIKMFLDKDKFYLMEEIDKKYALNVG